MLSLVNLWNVVPQYVKKTMNLGLEGGLDHEEEEG